MHKDDTVVPTLTTAETTRAQQIYTYLLDRKQVPLTAAQIEGILGNMQVESDFDATARSDEGAVGLCQWEGTRLTALETYAADQGNKPVTDWQTQVDFMLQEMQQLGIQLPNSAAQAAETFATQYEKCAASSVPQRVQDAQAIGQSLNTNPTAAAGTSSSRKRRWWQLWR